METKRWTGSRRVNKNSPDREEAQGNVYVSMISYEPHNPGEIVSIQYFNFNISKTTIKPGLAPV